jgi:hypothetical protein
VRNACAHPRTQRGSARYSSCARHCVARSTLDERRAWRLARLATGGSAMRSLLRLLG